MRTLLFLLEKEFRQILRNRQIIRILIIAPVIQLILLPLAADYSVKNISIAVVDNDHSTFSQKMIAKITASGHFRLTGYVGSYKEAVSLIEQDKADLALQIPAHFERDLVRENSQKLYISVNAIEGTKANLGAAYLSSIISDYNSDIRMQWQSGPATNMDDPPRISVAPSNWYNPYLNYTLYMVPAILVTLVTAMAAMQSAFNIVQEKESGTIEQINVTPIKKHIFILGKLIPFLVLGIIIFTIGLLVGRILFHAGAGPAAGYLLRHPDAGHVPVLLLHQYFQPHERGLQLGGQYAPVGPDHRRDLPPQSFHKNNANGCAERQRLPRYHLSPRSHGRHRAGAEHVGGVELPEDGIIFY